MQLALPRWLRARRPGPTEPGIVALGHRRVYILPTAHGMGFSFVLLLMLAGSVNYGLSLGFVLTFLLSAMGINGMLYTFRNLANLRLSTGRVEPVFAGETARFPVRIDNPGIVARAGLRVAAPGAGEGLCDVAPGSASTVTIDVPSTRRGYLRPGRLVIDTRFPLGLFRAWSYYTPEAVCLVYPQPEEPGIGLPAAEPDADTGTSAGAGYDDFAGLRNFQSGDSPRHVAWKADARAQGLLTKVFAGRADARRVWLSWDLLPASMSTDARIARLARWVLDAERAGWEYGLRLPPNEVAPATGEAHCAHCLELLALHDEHAQA